MIRSLWSWTLKILAIIIVLDALAVAYILTNPGDPLAESLRRYEPVVNLLMKSDLGVEPSKEPDLQPAVPQHTIVTKQGVTRLTTEAGYPVFAEPDIESEVIGMAPPLSKHIVTAVEDGWYKLELQQFTGWIHPGIGPSQYAILDKSRENTRTAAREGDRVLSGDFRSDSGMQQRPSLYQRQLGEIFEQFDAADLAQLPTNADPHRLAAALELMGDDMQHMRGGDFILFFHDPLWARRSSSLLRSLRNEYVSLLGPAIIDTSARSSAFVFLMSSMSAYKDFYPPQFAAPGVITAGHYEGGIMAVHPNRYQGSGRYRTLVHEAAHHYNYLFLRLSRSNSPIWLEEGLATYFGYSRQSSDGAIQPGEIPADADSGSGNGMTFTIEDSPRRRIESMQVQAGFLNIRRLIGLSHDAFYGSTVIRNYTSSWLLVHFFLHGEGGSLRAPFFEYIRKTRLQPISEEEFEAVFGESIDSLNQRWRAYVLSL